MAGSAVSSAVQFFHIVSLLGAMAVLVVIPTLHVMRNQERTEYGSMQYAILIDAGSSGSRLSVYQWDQNAIYRGTGVISQLGSGCANRSAKGISQYAAPGDAAESLVGCLQEAIRLVPSNHHQHTPLYLAATAGMRLLHETNASHSDAIFEAISDLFRTYPFKFEETDDSKYARIITGQEEGLYGWITVNYLLGLISPNEASMENTTGALDLGGASTQITFVPEYNDTTANVTDFYKSLTIYGDRYDAYSHSFLCWGLNEAHRRYLGNLVKASNYTPEVDDPCGLAGNMVNVTGDFLWLPPCSSGPEAMDAWGSILHAPDLAELSAIHEQQLISVEDAVFRLRGTGDVAECHRLNRQLFPQGECPYPSCSFNGVYQPDLGQNKFMAFAGYFYQSEPLNITGHVTLQRLVDASDAVCKMTLEEVLKLPNMQADFASRYCFSFMYAVSLLADGYKFPLESVLDVRGDVNGTETGWALGYVIDASGVIPLYFGPAAFLSDLSYSLVLACGGLIFVLSSLYLVYLVRRDRRKRAGYTSLETRA